MIMSADTKSRSCSFAAGAVLEVHELRLQPTRSSRRSLASRSAAFLHLPVRCPRRSTSASALYAPRLRGVEDVIHGQPRFALGLRSPAGSGAGCLSSSGTDWPWPLVFSESLMLTSSVVFIVDDLGVNDVVVFLVSPASAAPASAEAPSAFEPGRTGLTGILVCEVCSLSSGLHGVVVFALERRLHGVHRLPDLGLDVLRKLALVFLEQLLHGVGLLLSVVAQISASRRFLSASALASASLTMRSMSSLGEGSTTGDGHGLFLVGALVLGGHVH